MVFPTLFPYGKRDPTCKGRHQAITLTDALNTWNAIAIYYQMVVFIGDLHHILNFLIGPLI